MLHLAQKRHDLVQRVLSDRDSGDHGADHRVEIVKSPHDGIDRNHSALFGLLHLFSGRGPQVGLRSMHSLSTTSGSAGVADALSTLSACQDSENSSVLMNRLRREAAFSSGVLSDRRQETDDLNPTFRRHP